MTFGLPLSLSLVINVLGFVQEIPSMEETALMFPPGDHRFSGDINRKHFTDSLKNNHNTFSFSSKWRTGAHTAFFLSFFTFNSMPSLGIHLLRSSENTALKCISAVPSIPFEHCHTKI